MVHILSYTLIATFIAAYYVSCESCSTLNPRYNAPVAADGWTYQVIADDFTRPRGLLVDARGGLLVVDATVGIIHLTIEDTGGGCLTTSKKKSIIQSRDVSSDSQMETVLQLTSFLLLSLTMVLPCLLTARHYMLLVQTRSFLGDMMRPTARSIVRTRQL
jgi:hypothetical protein